MVALCGLSFLGSVVGMQLSTQLSKSMGIDLPYSARPLIIILFVAPFLFSVIDPRQNPATRIVDLVSNALLFSTMCGAALLGHFMASDLNSRGMKIPLILMDVEAADAGGLKENTEENMEDQEDGERKRRKKRSTKVAKPRISNLGTPDASERVPFSSRMSDIPDRMSEIGGRISEKMSQKIGQMNMKLKQKLPDAHKLRWTNISEQDLD